jgi:hypothetical protein
VKQAMFTLQPSKNLTLGIGHTLPVVGVCLNRIGTILPARHSTQQGLCGKFCEGLRELFKQDRLQLHNSLQQLASPGAFSHFLWQLGLKGWVVYAKPRFGGGEHVLNYLVRPIFQRL